MRATETMPTKPLEASELSVTERALLRSAMAMAMDPVEARDLVEKTLASAGPQTTLSEAQLFGLLRRTYHSVERTRRRRPMRDASVTSLARASVSAPAGGDH